MEELEKKILEMISSAGDGVELVGSEIIEKLRDPALPLGVAEVQVSNKLRRMTKVKKPLIQRRETVKGALAIRYAMWTLTEDGVFFIKIMGEEKGKI